MDVPIAELLHQIIGETTDKLILSDLKRLKKGDSTAIERLDRHTQVEEGIVHGASEILTKKLANEMNMQISREYLNSSRDNYKGQTQYQYVEQFRKYIERNGVRRTIDEYINNPAILIKKVIE